MTFPRWFLAFMLCLGSLQGSDLRSREHYFQQLQSNPTQTAVQDRLIDLLKKNGDEAAFFQSQPTNESTEVVRGYLYLRQKQYPEARASFERAAQKSSTLWPWRGLADLASAENQPQKAAQALEKALEKNSSAELLGWIAEKWFQAGQPDKARRYLQQAVAADPDNRDLRRRLAQQFMEIGETELARQQWQTLADTASAAERFEALRELALLQEQLSQYAEATRTLERAATELSPTSWQRITVDQDLLRLHRLAGTLDQLEARWQSDHLQDPRQPLAALRLANLYAERENFAAQRATLQHSYLANPDSLDLLKAMAEAENASGAPEKALDYFEILGRRQPKKTEPRYRQAELLIRLGRVPEAEALLASLRQTHSKDPGMIAELRAFLEHHRLADPLIALLRQLALTDPNEIPALIEQQLHWERTPDSVDLDALPLPAKRRAEIAQDLSERFQRHQNLPAAVEWARQASRMEPENANAAIRVTDLLPRAQAAEWLEAWIAERGHALPLEKVDQRLYQLATKEPNPTEENSPAQSSLDLLMMLPSRSSEPPAPTPPLLRMMAAHQVRPSPEGARRVARWHRWRNDLSAASATLRLALETFPQSIELRQELARVTADLGDFPTAIRLTEKLRQEDWKNAARHDRQIARFETERGELGAALVIFQKLANENPTSPEVWRDLALTQQKSDYWFDSLASWTRAAELASPSERYEMRTSILSATQRLGLHPQGQTYLRALAEETSDPLRKNALREELATYIDQTGGNASAAKGTKEVSPLPPQPKPALHTARVRAYFREPANLDAWLEVARVSSAEALPGIWEEIVQRFPRDPRALRMAADYSLQRGQLPLAATLFSRELALGGATAPKHLAAGKLHLRLGDRLKALDHLEKAWHLTRDPLEPGTQFPLHSFGRKTSLATSASNDPALNLRREMIQEISRLVRGGNAKAVWLQRWQALTDPAEKITGLTAIGEVALALDELTRLLAKQPDHLDAVQSFFSLCVGEENFERAFAQLENHPEHFSDWMEIFQLTLNEKLRTQPATHLTPLITQASLPTLTAQALRWPLANLFAANQRYTEAATLGTLALDSQTVPNPSEAALKIADWHLCIGKWESARATLLRAQTDEASELTHPALTAARLEWLLATPDEQKQLLETARTQSAQPLSPPQSAARYALFSALAQSRAELPRAMDRLIRAQHWGVTHEDSPLPFSHFVRTSSNALVQWGLPDAAAELLARAMDSDPVLLLLRAQMASTQREELRLPLLGTRLLAHPPARRMGLLQDLLAESSLTLENLMGLGLFFEQAGSPPVAYRCYEFATRRFGLNDALLAARLRTARPGVDSQAWIETCQLAARFKHPTQPQMALAAASQLALIAGAEGRNAEAESLLRKASSDFPENEIILRQTAEHYLKQQNPRNAQALLAASRIPLSAPLAVLQMHAALARGEESKAKDLFMAHPAFEKELFPLLLAHSVSQNQIKTLANLIQPSLKDPLNQLKLWEAIALQGSTEQQTEAREAIYQLVKADPSLFASYYLFRKKLARQTGQVNEFINELREEWRGGQYFAGEILIQLLVEEKRIAGLDEIVNAFIQQPSVGEPALIQLAQILEEACVWESAAAVYAVLEGRHPASLSYRLSRARALTKAGREAETLQPLAELHRTRHALPGATQGLAHYYLRIGQPKSARMYFAEMKMRSSAIEQSTAYLGLTRCALDLGDLADAETQLREAAALDLSPQVARLAAECGKADSPSQLSARFKKLGLTPPIERLAREQVKQILQNAPLPSSP